MRPNWVTNWPKLASLAEKFNISAVFIFLLCFIALKGIPFRIYFSLLQLVLLPCATIKYFLVFYLRNRSTLAVIC